MINKKYEELYQKFINHYKEKHVNPWHNITEEELDKTYNNLINNMDIIDDYTFDYFINYIIKRLSGKEDAHTQYSYIKNPFLPIKFHIIENEILVKKPEELRGAKLIEINNIDIEKIVNELEDIITYGTKGKRKEKLEDALAIRRKLFSIPSLRNSNEVTYKLKMVDGNVIEKSYLKDKDYETRENKEDKNATYEIKNDTLIYYHQSLQPRYEEKIKRAIQNLEKEDLTNIKRIIIDLRGNIGGNASFNKGLIEFLSKQNKELIVLTNYKIFSGGRYALINLIELGALTIGEEIGTPINCYGNSNWLKVDDYVFAVSEKYLYPKKNKYICAKTKEEFKSIINKNLQIPEYFKPDIEIEETKEDFINGIDSILNYALNYTDKNVKKQVK